MGSKVSCSPCQFGGLQNAEKRGPKLLKLTFLIFNVNKLKLLHHTCLLNEKYWMKKTALFWENKARTIKLRLIFFNVNKLKLFYPACLHNEKYWIKNTANFLTKDGKFCAMKTLHDYKMSVHRSNTFLNAVTRTLFTEVKLKTIQKNYESF